jgi:DNA-binding transcriptional MerR regulator
METTYSISDLAAAADVSPRTVRFYIQEGLLPPPEGAGRGSHYTAAHLATLRRIADLQRAGHALGAIRQLLAAAPIPHPPAPPGVVSPNPPTPAPPPPPRPARAPLLTSTLVTKVEITDGVELLFDATKFRPTVEGLLALKALARQVFGHGD